MRFSLSKFVWSAVAIVLSSGGVGIWAQQKPAAKQTTANTTSRPAQQTAVAKKAAIEIPKIPFTKYKLDNGLEVILSEDHRLPLVAVNLWYHVGAANEVAGRTGFAHLFEHMMFEGSKHVTGNTHFRLLEAAGASDINGTTNFDRTNYFETLPANQLELALWLESDRMGYLPDMLDQTNLSNQQDVVRNERRQSHENVPYGIVQEKMFHLLFPKEHPYYGEVIGSHADIQAAQLDEIRKFFRTYYAPNNASLAIVGDFDAAQARAWVEKYFGPLKSGPEVPKIQVTTPPVTSERRAVVEDNVQLPRVYLAWLTSPFLKPGDAEGDMVGQILGGGRSSRLYKKLVYDKQIALDVSANQQSLMLRSVFQITATVRPGHTPEEVEKAINEELDTFRKNGPTAAEMSRARNVIESGTIEQLETLGGFGGVADRLNSYNHYLGTPDYLKGDIHRYEGATQETVRLFADSQLSPNSLVVVYGVPGKPDFGPEVPTPKTEKTGEAKADGEPVNADSAWRAEPPKPGAARPLSLPVPVEFKLANGLTVLFSERPGLPLVAANLVLRSGSGANPADKPGLASLTANLLQQGTASRNASEIADRTAELGASLNAGATTDTSSISTQSLSRSFPETLELLSDIAQHANFPQQELDRLKSRRIAALTQERGNPIAVAFRIGAGVLYGSNSSYGYPDSGTEDSIKGMTREDVQRFWEQHYVPGDAALIVAGNIKLAELKALVEKSFGAWKAGTVGAGKIAAPETSATRLVLVDRPGAPQTAVVCASVGAERSTPDFPALEVMNTELGGLFSSRVNLNLREKHGYTYGAGSRFIWHREPGPFVVFSQVRTDATAPAVSEIFNELKRMRETLMTPEELSLAKDSISRSMPGQFETGSEAAATFTSLFAYGFPLDYYSKLPARIDAVTADQAQAVAQKYIVPEKIIVLAVGDKAKIGPELQKLNLGQTEVRDANGKPVQ